MRKLFVLIAAGAFLVAYSVPAIAAEWSFSGSARVETWFDSVDNPAPGLDDDDLNMGQTLTAGISGNVEAGDISGGFLYWTENEVLYTPHDLVLLWGAWNYGGGTITVGKNWTPCNIFISNMTHGSDQDLMWWGALWGEAPAGLHLNTGGLQVAVVKPQEPWGPAAGAYVNVPTGAPNADTDTTIPKIEVGYSFNAGPAALKVFGGYNTYDQVDVLDNEYGVDSYVLGVMFKVGLGAAYINGDIHMGQNLGQYIPHGAYLGSNCDAGWTGTDIADNDHLGYALVLGYKASDMITLEVGYAHLESELDLPGTWEDPSAAYYINMVINVAEGFSITPEIGVIDGDDITQAGVTTEQSDTTYWGAKWMINF